MTNRSVLAGGLALLVPLLVLAAPLAFAACSSSTTNAATPSNGTNGEAGATGGDADTTTGEGGTTPPAGDAGTFGTADIPPATSCPTAKYKTLVVVGDSISDVGGSGGTPDQEPFYRTLLLKNDDTKYPDWKGFDLTTCWGLAAANVVKVSKGGAVATIPVANDPTNMAILANQVASLPATLDGPVLVVGTIGGNDVQGGLITLLTGTPAQVQTKVDAFVAGFGAAMTELTKPDRFGAGVKVEVLMTNVYDPSGGTGHFYYEPSAASCPGALGLWPDKKETKTALAQWNDAMVAEAAKHPGVLMLELAAPFAAHAVASPAATNWFFQDCIHPDSLGHNALRGVFWAGMRSLP